MADLLTHAATAWLPGRTIRDGRMRAVLYLGVCLPDALYKGLHFLFGASTWVCEITHAPLVVPAICAAVALLFEEEWRRRAFFALMAGSWLHLLVDLGKSALGEGVILWGFPFTMDRVELSLYQNEDMVFVMPFALGFLVVFEVAARMLGSARTVSKTG